MLFLSWQDTKNRVEAEIIRDLLPSFPKPGVDSISEWRQFLFVVSVTTSWNVLFMVFPFFTVFVLWRFRGKSDTKSSAIRTQIWG